MKIPIENIADIHFRNNQTIIIKWKDSDLVHVYDASFVGEYRLSDISTIGMTTLDPLTIQSIKGTIFDV